MEARVPLLMLGLVAAIGLGAWGGRSLLAARAPSAAAAPAAVPEPTPQPATEPVPEPDRELTARVNGVKGDAEVFLPSEGRWRPVELGQTLGPDAVLRTRNGQVDLSIGPGVDVSVGPASQFRLHELSSRLSKVRLEGGRVTASVDGKSGPELLVQVTGSDAEARTNDGDFAMLRSGGGQLTLASTRGRVRLSAAGKEVVVNTGEQSEVVPGRSPLSPGAIPGAVFLELSRGQQRKLRQRFTVVEGETARGAVVSINGVESATEQGHFSLRVPLQEGKNDLDIIARDALGRQSRRRVQGIDVDSSPPVLRGKVQW
jgi:hypothetical protein